MEYSFRAYGHPNIKGSHKTTLEFTKDKEVSLKGDCIIGVKADFDVEKIKGFFKKSGSKKIKIIIKTITKDEKSKIEETVYAELNPSFNSHKELVIRKTEFLSERTFAIKANNAASDLNRNLIAFLKEGKNKIGLTILGENLNN